MSASSIQAKVKAGLAKANVATGSTGGDKIFIVDTYSTAGTPLNPGASSSVNVLLPNAIFKSYDAKMLNSTILAGDRMLVCDNTNPIKQGDKVRQGDAVYIVINVDIKSPVSDVLVYIAQIRLN